MPDPTLEVLDKATCLELLSSTPVGRIGFVSRGEPMILPVNHAVEDEAIFFRTTRGAKWDLAQQHAGARVVFEADGWEPASRIGWSVLAHGTIEPVLDEVEVQRLDRLGLYVWVDDTSRQYWIRVNPKRITGRRIVAPDTS